MRKPRKVLTIEKKCKVLDDLNNSGLMSAIARRYGVAKTTISGIKKRQFEIKVAAANEFQGKKDIALLRRSFCLKNIKRKTKNLPQV